MNNFLKSLGLLLITSVVFMACQENDNITNDITIEIISPIENEIVADPSKVNIHVKMTATEELHRVEIILTEKNKDAVIIKQFSKYAHSKQFEYQETVDLSGFPAGTEFQLRTEGCANHECGQSITKTIFFKK